MPRDVAAYVAMRSEADPRPIFDLAYGLGATVGLPVIAPGASLVFRHYEGDYALVPGGFGTMVPADDAPLLDPDLIIVPRGRLRPGRHAPRLRQGPLRPHHRRDCAHAGVARFWSASPSPCRRSTPSRTNPMMSGST